MGKDFSFLFVLNLDIGPEKLIQVVWYKHKSSIKGTVAGTTTVVSPSHRRGD